MTNKELIEILSKLPPDSDVEIMDRFGTTSRIKEVYETETYDMDLFIAIEIETAYLNR